MTNFVIENSVRSTFQPDLTVLVKPPKGHWNGDKLRDPFFRRLFREPFPIDKNTVKHPYPFSDQLSDQNQIKKFLHYMISSF